MKDVNNSKNKLKMLGKDTLLKFRKYAFVSGG